MKYRKSSGRKVGLLESLGSPNRPQVAVPVRNIDMAGLDLPEDDSDLIMEVVSDEDEDSPEGSSSVGSDLPEDDSDLLDPVMAEEGIAPEDGPAVEAKADLPPAPKSSASEGSSSESEPQMQIFDPIHNLREMSKQLTLLEDHLAHPAKFCPDCIRKHLLSAEAFAEEAISLDKTGEHRELLAGLPMEVRGIAKAFQERERAKLSPEERQSLTQRARVLRKRLSKASFGSVSSAQSPSSSPSSGPKVDHPPAGTPTAATSAPPLPAPGVSADRVSKELLESARRDLRGQGILGVGDGKDKLVVYVASKTTKVPAVYRGVPVVRMLSVPPRDMGSRVRFGVDYAAGLTAGMPILYAAPRVGTGRFVDWRRGTLTPGVPQPNATGQFQVMAPTPVFVRSDLVVKSPPRPISSLLRGKKVSTFDIDGTARSPFVLTEGQLAVADAIQSVFQANLVDVCADLGLTFGQSLGDAAGEIAEARNRACRIAIPGKLLAGAIVNAIYESNLDPGAASSTEPAIGVWQQKAESGMSVEDRQDLKKSTERVLADLKRIAKTSKAFQSLVARDLAAASSPGVPGVRTGDYAGFFAREIVKPAVEPDLEAGVRARTAASLFEGASAFSPAPKKPRIQAPAPVVAPSRGLAQVKPASDESSWLATGLFLVGGGLLGALAVFGAASQGSADGAHIPGPYARPGAMVKSGSFVDVDFDPMFGGYDGAMLGDEGDLL